jgi:hypothetical protein
MYNQKIIQKNLQERIESFCWHLEGQGRYSMSRIRIHWTEAWIRGSGSVPIQKCPETTFHNTASNKYNDAYWSGVFKGRRFPFRPATTRSTQS